MILLGVRKREIGMGCDNDAPLALNLARLEILQAHETPSFQLTLMNDMVGLYVLFVSSCDGELVEGPRLTSGEHALHKVGDVTEHNSKAFRCTLLPSQRFDLHTL